MFVDSDTVNEFRSEDRAIHVIERRCKLDMSIQTLSMDTAKGNPPKTKMNLCLLLLLVALGCYSLTLFLSVLKIAGVDYVYFIQKNSLNSRRTLHIEAIAAFSNRVIISEHCCYSVSPLRQRR